MWKFTCFILLSLLGTVTCRCEIRYVWLRKRMAPVIWRRVTLEDHLVLRVILPKGDAFHRTLCIWFLPARRERPGRGNEQKGKNDDSTEISRLCWHWGEPWGKRNNRIVIYIDKIPFSMVLKHCTVIKA